MRRSWLVCECGILVLAALLSASGALGEESIQDFAGFLTGGRMDVKLRSYYMDRRDDETYGWPGSQELAWTAGGWLDWSTASWKGIRFGVSLYASQKIVGPEDKDGTDLLAPGQRSFAVLGQAWGEATVGKTTARLFRQAIDTPFLNFRDDKMAPFTFEAYTLENRDVTGLLATVSYVTKVKTWASTEFVELGTDAGYLTASPLTLAGLSWTIPGEAVRLQAWDYSASGEWNTFYAQVDAGIPLGRGFSTVVSGQWIQQRGQEGGRNGPFSTWMWGAMATLGWRGSQDGFAVTDTSLSHEVVNPWAGYPGFTSIMEEDNNLAGERSWLLTATVDLSALGLPGLTVHGDWTKSWTRSTIIGLSKKDQYESDVTVDYAFSGALKGFALRARAAWVESSVSSGVLGGQDFKDYRLILNYDLPLAPLLRR